MNGDVEKSRAGGEKNDFLQRLTVVTRVLDDPVEIQGTACSMLAEKLNADRAYYVEVDEEAGLARVDRDYVRPGVASLVGEYDLSDFGWSVNILGRGECHVVSDTRTSELVPDPERPASVNLGIIASLGAPLVKGGKLVGALCVTTSAPRDWQDSDVSLLQDVADLIWSAIQRARAEATAALSEVRYRALVEAMDEAVSLVERLPQRPNGLRDYRFITMNRAMQNMFGIPDLSGRSIRDNFPNEVDAWCDDLDRVLETGKPMRIERESVPLGMVLETFITRIEDGTTRSLMAVIRDVTGRIRAENALRENNERQAFLLELSDALRTLRDAVEIQRVAMRLLGKHLGVMRAAYGELEEDQDAFTLTACWEAPAAGNLPEGITLSKLGADIRDGYRAGRTLVVRDGEHEGLSDTAWSMYRAARVAAWIGVPLVKEGRLLALVGVQSDVPRDWTPGDVSLVEDVAERTWAAVERAHVEVALRESEERLIALIMATSNVVYRMSPDWSELWEIDGHGFVKDVREPTSSWLDDYIDPVDQPEVKAAIRAAIDSKSTFQLEHRVKRRDGTPGWVFSRAIPLMDEAGNIVEWFGAASDVTARRQAVEALTHTQRLDSVGRLAGSIAHDFNNLLTVIMANIELADFRTDEAARKLFLDKAMRAAQLGERLNQRLLVWAGRGPARPQLLNLNDLVNDISTILDRSIGERIKLMLDLDRNLWPTFSDPAHIDSAILNLAVNARDALPMGGEIRLATANVTFEEGHQFHDGQVRQGDYVCLSISDDGKGMSPEVQKRALEPFFSAKSDGTGVGLGLFSVQSMVEQSGGFLEFDSQLGQGTTFRLFLPRAKEKAAPGTLHVEASPAPGLPSKNIRVLVVEDQEDVREATRERLEALGYEVVSAKDANEALEMLSSDPAIRAVFSDVVMPGDMSGRDLARRIMADYPNVSILLTSGYTADAIPPAANDHTANVPLLAKPYRLQDLEQALAQLLGDAAQAQAGK